MPQIFKVGGCIRDAMLGKESKDIDFTFVIDDLSQSVEAGFKYMDEWMRTNGYQIFLSTPDMFTIRAKFPKDHPNEGLVADFVMARKEVGYVEGTRRPILELGTLHDDLIRRDFTVNAMAEDIDGTLIDPFNGADDLKLGFLRTPLDPVLTMMDDPLRILRAMRFSITKGFEIDTKILWAVKQPEILEKLKTVVSAQRIREELDKMMKYDTPATLEMIHRFNLLIPGFTKMIFDRGLWLKPTFEKK
jgi:tRNA nucleotidyltransferase/poly(A) polymerase